MTRIESLNPSESKKESSLNITSKIGETTTPGGYSSSQKDNSYAVVRHERGFYYVQRRKSLSGSSAIQRKCKNDLRKTRKNNAIYRKKVATLETKIKDLENSNSKLVNEKLSLETASNRIQRQLSNSENQNSLLTKENSKLEDDLESQVLNIGFLPFELMRKFNFHFDLSLTIWVMLHILCNLNVWLFENSRIKVQTELS